MLFLIEYDRNRGRIVTIRSFNDSNGQSAEESRLQLELELNLKGTDNEVVLLEAATEEALRRTHRRYFEDLTELNTAPGSLTPVA
jgi:hypothetical protein